MIDLSEKEHVPSFYEAVAMCEKHNMQVICYKETYTEAKCLIDGWDISIPHKARNIEKFFEVFIRDNVEKANSLFAAGLYKTKSIDLPRFKSIKSRIK